MKRLLRVVAVACALVQPLAAQQPRSVAPPPQRESALDFIRAAEPAYADPATRRLEILAEVWGNTGLHHPAVYVKRLDWDSVLIEALRWMQRVQSDRDLVDLLNRVVFAGLDDPLTYAAVRAEAVALPAHRPVPARWLDSVTAYVDASNEEWEDPRHLRAVLDSLGRQRPVGRLVFDLRYEYRPSFWLIPPLGPWAREPIALGPDISILRSTEDRLGSGNFLVSPRDSLLPASPAVTMPTVFLVSRASYATFERVLDAVRSRRTDVAVILEQTGPVPNLNADSWSAWYPDSIVLSHTRSPILSADGALGSVVDATLPRAVALDELPRLADAALASRAAQGRRAPFVFRTGGDRDDKVSLGPLTREERIAGVLKLWYWVKTFYAYPEDITGDWRRALATWVPLAESAPSDTAHYLVLRRMAALMNDTHAQVYHPMIGSGSLAQRFSPPVQLEWVEHRLLVMRVDTAGPDLGIARGDEVVAVDGRPVAAVVADERPYWSFSRDVGNDLPPFTFMTGSRGTTVRLGVSTSTGVRQVALPRSRPGRAVVMASAFAHPPWAVLPDNLGYIDLTQLASLAAFDSAMAAVSGTRGLILDVRRTVQSDFEVLLPWFVSEPAPWMRRMFAVSYRLHAETPTRAIGAQREWTVPDWPSRQPVTAASRYTRPLVVMISGRDVSHGESLPIWLKLAGRATFVGSATNGTYYSGDSFTLPGGARVQITRVRAVWPDGSKFHGIGVVPDVPVAPTVAGVRAGRDEVYERAVETLRRIVGR